MPLPPAPPFPALPARAAVIDLPQRPAGPAGAARRSRCTRATPAAASAAGTKSAGVPVARDTPRSARAANRLVAAERSVVERQKPRLQVHAAAVSGAAGSSVRAVARGCDYTHVPGRAPGPAHAAGRVQRRARTPCASLAAIARESHPGCILSMPPDPSRPANGFIRCDGRTSVFLNDSAADIKAAACPCAAISASGREPGATGVAAVSASAACSASAAAWRPRPTETTSPAIAGGAAHPCIAPVATRSSDRKIARKAASLIQLEQTA